MFYQKLMILAMTDSLQNSVNLHNIRYFVLWLMENRNNVEQNFVVLFLLFSLLLSSSSKSTTRTFRFDLDLHAVIISINSTTDSKLYIGLHIVLNLCSVSQVQYLMTAISDRLQADVCLLKYH